ncbi:hypothetical protein H0H81_002492 [Sphagnurus paluster]|uniref:Uncharacterized protein n=1 Tax=Sphagnurus paluster TaxID=117069 RepID=A0A9P7FT14_9AGAR|nr:hypothetical protein H0H81_002492 [Sphagnurus paluster]
MRGADGQIISNTSNSPRCPGTATLATACERSRQERLRIEDEKIAAVKKAAFIKSTYTDKGAIAVGCEEFITEKAQIRRHYVPPLSYQYSYLGGSRNNHPLLRLICNNPRLFATIHGAENTALGGQYKEFFDDLKAMVKTEYGPLFVMPAEDKIKFEETLKACQKELYANDKSLDGKPYRAPTDQEVDVDFVRLPILPQECLRRRVDPIDDGKDDEEDEDDKDDKDDEDDEDNEDNEDVKEGGDDDGEDPDDENSSGGSS